MLNSIHNYVQLGLKLILFAGLTACSYAPTHPQTTSLQTLYDSRIIDQNQNVLTVQQAAAQLKNSDVIFIGEYHGHQGSHLLQSQLQHALYAQQPKQILSMEQFERDTQTILNRYLFDEIGEHAFIQQSRAWNNYRGSYRPLVEFAKLHGLDVVAANAPADIVRCVGREGANYLTKLTNEQRNWITQAALTSNADYEAKFKNFMQQGKSAVDPQRLQQSFLAQLLRDATMAESIYLAKQQAPGYQVIHLNGAFHSNEFLGTVAELKKLDATLKISVVSPLMVKVSTEAGYQIDDLKLGDLVYLLLPLPAEYLDQAEQLKAMQNAFKDAANKTCQ